MEYRGECVQGKRCVFLNRCSVRPVRSVELHCSRERGKTWT
jgi:hypothetical protein